MGVILIDFYTAIFAPVPKAAIRKKEITAFIQIV
jgi:hypothetical protein